MDKNNQIVKFLQENNQIVKFLQESEEDISNSNKSIKQELIDDTKMFLTTKLKELSNSEQTPKVDNVELITVSDSESETESKEICNVNFNSEDIVTSDQGYLCDISVSENNSSFSTLHTSNNFRKTQMRKRKRYAKATSNSSSEAGSNEVISTNDSDLVKDLADYEVENVLERTTKKEKRSKIAPRLSPEEFDKRMPPASPLHRGSLPRDKIPLQNKIVSSGIRQCYVVLKKLRSSSTKVQGKAKKEVLTEDSNKTDENLETKKSAQKNITEESPKSSKRVSRKRRAEEKENVIDRSIVEEVQNINEREPIIETNSENPAKGKDIVDKPKPKKAKKAPLTAEDEEDNTNLPNGWTRKTVVRKSGKTAGQIDVYIYSPDGIKFRSRPDVRAYLAKTKSNLKLEDFNFSKKASSSDSTVKLIPKKEKATSTTKPKSKPEKKRAKELTPKKTAKLLVKLKFSPKKSKERKVANKSTKEAQSSAKNKASGSGSKISKKKKNA